MGGTAQCPELCAWIGLFIGLNRDRTAAFEHQGKGGCRRPEPFHLICRAPLIAAAGLTAALAAAYVVLWPADTASTIAPVPAVAPLAALEGDWIAEVQKDGQRPFTVALTFVGVGDGVAGMVRYPTGDAPILDGRLSGSVLTFHTSHVPQFESTPAIIEYHAEISGDEIRFTTTDQYGIGKGVARRRPPSP